MRKLGIPTVIDRTLQQAITQQLVPIYEPLFAEGSYGYRPNRSAKTQYLRLRSMQNKAIHIAVVLDLSKYFDTINHEILINLLRKNVKDERVVQLIKRYLKSGVMENGGGHRHRGKAHHKVEIYHHCWQTSTSMSSTRNT